MMIRPQPGPQEAFLASDADVVFYGGAAGGGKSFALLLDTCRFSPGTKGVTSVIFRRTHPEITNPGGLWDESCNLLPHAGAQGTRGALRWVWKSGSWLKFSHMQHDGDVYSWQGSQITMIGFDELTHFTEQMFFYMMSRNRSSSGVRPYMRATMNPDPNSWVRSFIDWYIGPDGLIVPERSGIVRFFARRNGVVTWAEDRESLVLLGLTPKSFTFIAAKLSDNAILCEKDPDYRGNLEAQVTHERERLLNGNWDARATPGIYFKRTNFEIVDVAPEGGSTVRYWDRASTRPSAENTNPDWTRGCRMRKVGGIYYILHMESVRDTPAGVERTIMGSANENPDDTVWLEEDPGQAGVADVDNLTRMLAGYDVRRNRVTKAKEIRARPLSAQVEAGNVKLVRGPWNKAFLDELEQFPDPEDKAKDDQVDASSGAFNALAGETVNRIRSL